MIATAHTQTGALAAPAQGSALHTALLTAAAVIVGSFLIGLLLVASMMLAGPLPASEGAPLPQLMPQPSATSG